MVTVEKGDRFNLLVAVAAGFLVFVFNWLFRFPAFAPETWNDLAAAVGLRPAVSLAGVLTRGVLASVFAAVPDSFAFVAVRLLGWISGGLIAFLSCRILSASCGGLAFRPEMTWRGFQAAGAVTAMAASVFALSDVVWYATQTLSAPGLQIMLGLAAVRLLQRFRLKRDLRPVIAATVLVAVLAVEAPIAAFGVAAAVFVAAAVLLRIVMAAGTSGCVRRHPAPALVAVSALVAALVAGMRCEPTLYGMLQVIDDCLEETVDECRGATRVFTDGSQDAGLELKAYEAGRRLRGVPLAADDSPHDLALRTREPADADGLKAVALQLGFGFWRGKAFQPVALGLVALPPGFASPPEDAAVRGELARDLARRVIRLYEDGDPDRTGSSGARAAFRAAQRQLSRLASLRADAVGRDGWCAAAEEERRLADRLRELDAGSRPADPAPSRGAEPQEPPLTPREELKLALDSEDFKLARRCAEKIVTTSPDDPHANFALAVDCLFDEDWPRAELYLKRVLERRPDDPAVLNNLAVAELRLCRYRAAETHAMKAAAVLPDSPEVKRTLGAVRRAVENGACRP